jgi:lipoate-protein ligase A
MTAADDHQGDDSGPAMRLLDQTLSTPAENLALDEALLDAAEMDAESSSGPDAGSGEILRLWEATAPLVVIGRSSRIDEEVDRAACTRLGVPILRRSSGGAAIVAGPGCLMYAVVLSFDIRPQLRAIDVAHQFVLGRLAAALAEFLPTAEQRGTSDLAVAERKFSGNSLRVKRNHLLYHGTLLYDFPLDLISTCLRTPPRQPDYRERRTHRDFINNIPATSEQLRTSIATAFSAANITSQWPTERTAKLAKEKYASDAWTMLR